jgi:ElaB/YqjD/DUF883 family membrane-anchored ribosome-binding protein
MAERSAATWGWNREEGELAMANQSTFPEDDNAVIPEPENLGAIATDRAGGESDDDGTLTIGESSIARARRKVTDNGIATSLREGREKIASQAGEKARGLVAKGIERTADALANVSRMVGDTAGGIDERLGSEYGDYARRASGAIGRAADAIGSKDPDELIEDTRSFVRDSPGIALAGAAVVGFVLARFLKNGMNDQSDD